MSKKIKTPTPNKLPIGKFLAFRAANFAMAANYMIMGFVQIYCTNILHMDPILVGTILLVSKLFDAFGELYCGWIVDNAKKGRFGKVRKFDLFMIGQWICTVLLFSAPPNIAEPLKIAYVFIFYMLVQSVFQSIVQAANQPRLTSGFANMNVVMKVQSYGGVISMILSIGFNILFPKLVQSMATTPAGWIKLMITVSVPLCLIGLTRFFFVDEEFAPIDAPREEKIKMSEMVDVLRNNKYIWLVAGIGMLMQVVPGLGAAAYFFTFVIGDLGKMGTISMVSIALLPIMFFVPALARRIGVSKMIAIGGFVGVLGGVISFFAGSNITVILIAALLTSLAVLTPPYMSAVMIDYCALYNVYEGRARMEATLAAVTNFGGNLGSGIGGFISGIVLSMFGYVGTASVQSAQALLGIRVLYGIVPAIFYLLMAICALAFNIEKKVPEMETEIAARLER